MGKVKKFPEVGNKEVLRFKVLIIVTFFLAIVICADHNGEKIMAYMGENYQDAAICSMHGETLCKCPGCGRIFGAA